MTSIPLRVEVMDVDKKVKDENILEVQSPFVHQVSSHEFDESGLFSENIFGEVGTPERMIQHGFISLRAKMFHPRIYRTIVKMKRLYADIMAGKVYAKFDTQEKDFVAVDASDEQAKTGFSFFTKHIADVEFVSTGSITRDTKIEVLKKYKDRMFITKHLVMPAGIRDINRDSANSTSEEINKLYGGLFRITRAFPEDGSNSPIYDGVRWSMQRKIIAIYEYIKEITDGKRGFFQKKYGARGLALGTRNVISAANTNVSNPDSPQAIKSGETLMPLFQAMKSVQPLVVYHLKSLFFNHVISEGAAQVSVIDAKTGALGYVDVSIKEKDKFMTTEGIVSLINSYRDTDTRHDPVTIQANSGKHYFFYQVYLDKTDLYLVRSVSDLKSMFERHGKKFNRDNLHPMTRAEMFYIATYMATVDKYCTITRYPITGAESVYPSKIHLVSTTESTEVHLRSAANEAVDIALPHFPMVGSPSGDSLTPHPAQLANLGADKQICLPS